MPGSGNSSQTTEQSQQQSGITSLLQNQSQNQNGTTSATKSPWENAMPTINGILSKLNPLIASSGANPTQTAGLEQLKTNAATGNPFTSQISDVASRLLGGGGATNQAGAVRSNLTDLEARLSPTANANYSSLDDPRLKAALDQIATDVGTNVNGMFAGAGRDLSGANQGAVARGITSAQAPLILDQFNKDRTLQQSSAGTLYNAGNTTSGLLTAMDQTDNANRVAGVPVAGQAVDASNTGANAMINAGNLESSIPIQQLGLLAQIGLPIAGLGGTATGATSQTGTATNTANGTSSSQGSGTSTTTKNPSLLEQLTGWANLGSSLFASGEGGTSTANGLRMFMGGGGS